jgi:hypothetical protein
MYVLYTCILRALCITVPSPTWLTGTDFHVAYCNRVPSGLLKYSPKWLTSTEELTVQILWQLTALQHLSILLPPISSNPIVICILPLPLYVRRRKVLFPSSGVCSNYFRIPRNSGIVRTSNKPIWNCYQALILSTAFPFSPVETCDQSKQPSFSSLSILDRHVTK